MSIEAKDLVSEFIGTYLLCLTVGCNTVSTASGTWAALSIASVLMVSVYSLGSVSGAAFNPAVTLAVFLDSKKADPNAMPAAKMGAYMATQLVAGLCAGASSYMVHGEAMQLEPGPGYSYGGAAVAEIAYTFMLCLVVLRTAVVKGAKNEFFGLAIGFVIVAGGYGAGFISKGAFNPAVAFSVDFGSAGQGIYWCMFYTVFEFIGAAAAAMVSNYLGEEGVKATPAQTYVAEFLGTFFLILTVGFNVLGGSPAPALSIAASLMCMIYALGGISGAAFNPAVVLAVMLEGTLDASTAGMYVVAELAGGICAALVYTFTVGSAVPLAPGAGHNWATCAFAEIIFTFVLCFVVLNCAIDKTGKLSQFFGLAIGFVITAGGYAIGAVSGGSLNPAVSVALDASNAVKGGSFGNCAMYTLFELVGAGAAYGAYKVCRPDSKGALLGKVEKPSYGTA